MINNLKLGKKFLTGLLIASVIGTGVYHVHRVIERNRVKGYLEDFLTEDNYVDLSKISGDYDIKGFSGESLADVLEDSNIDYVRITDSYIYDGAHVTPFKQMNAVNYDKFLWEDKEGNKYYEMYEPIRDGGKYGVSYYVPEGFQLEEIECIAEPIRYDDLKDYEIEVIENDYEDSYSLSLERKK